MSEGELKEYYTKLIEELRFQRDTSTELAKHRGTCLNAIIQNNDKVVDFLERMVKIIKTQPPENLDKWVIEQLEIMISLLDSFEEIKNLTL